MNQTLNERQKEKSLMVPNLSNDVARNPECLIVQIQSDLVNIISTYPSRNKAIPDIAAKTNITDRSIRNIILGKSGKPHFQTVYKLYSFIYKTDDFSLLLNTVPPVIKELLLSNTPSGVNYSDKKIIFKKEIQAMIKKDPIFRKLYYLATTINFTKEEVQFRYGEHGIDTLNKMVELLVVRLNEKNCYELGSYCANTDEETAKIVSLDFINDFHKPENADMGGQNIIDFRARNLTLEEYNELLTDLHNLREKWSKRDNCSKHRTEENVQVFYSICADTMTKKGKIDYTKYLERKKMREKGALQ